MIIQTIQAIRKTNLGSGNYRNKSANKIVPIVIGEDGYSDVEAEDETKTEDSRAKEEATPDISLRYNRDEENSLCGGY